MKTTQTPVSHTPGPWTLSNEPNGFFVYSEARKRVNDPAIAHVYKDREADAEFIVRACNCHDELLAACKAVYSDPCATCACADKVRSAIAKAEGWPRDQV